MKRTAIELNRFDFLQELRTGNYKKGTIKSDDKGFPVIESPADNEGSCACAIMGQMFGLSLSKPGRISLSKAAKALGIDATQCAYIQKNINDTSLTFLEMADRIDKEVFTT